MKKNDIRLELILGKSRFRPDRTYQTETKNRTGFPKRYHLRQTHHLDTCKFFFRKKKTQEPRQGGAVFTAFPLFLKYML